MNLKEFQSAVEGLIKEYDKSRGEFDKSGNLSSDELSKFKDEVEELLYKQEKLKKEIVSPVKSGALKDVTYHTEQIRMHLKKIEEGLDNTDEIEFQLKALKGLFAKYNEVKKELQRLQGDLETMEVDIKEEGNKKKMASEDLRSVVKFVMKNSKSNMASPTEV